ncbi:ABC-2 type transporter family protein [Wolffia australiana]
MDEIRSYTENYRCSSSSPSSPADRAPSGNFFYLRKPGSAGRPFSFEDCPEWDEAEIDAQLEEGVEAINAATAAPSLYLPNAHSLSLSSPSVATERKIAGASVVWKDLTVIVRGKRNYSDQIVKSCSGYAMPGTLTVIMGPARSGKSTLLRAIAGKLPLKARIYGDVYVNGSKSRMPYGSFGYVDREEALIESLTVREYLYYSALLQIPGFFSCWRNAVEETIQAMSLADYTDKVIGGRCCVKGLSSGERRRISVARELITRPHVLFVDEPLYNLDSVSALLMMVTLKKLANTGCTLIFTMNQSSTEVFGLFDRICLLSNGNVLFFGETLACLQHFSNAGFPCPIMQSPSDHFLRAINTDFDRVIAMCRSFQDDNGDFSSVNMDTAVAIQTLEATYKQSSESAAVETVMEKLMKKDGPLLKNLGKVSGAKRVAIFTWRSLLVMSREWRYFWLRTVLCVLLALCIGSMFSNLGHSLSSVMARVSSVFVFVSFTSLLSIAALPCHIKEFKVYESEESNGHSGPLAFLLGHLLASIPFLFLLSISSSLVFYYLIGLRSELSLLVYFVLNLLACILASDGLMMVVSYLWPEPFLSTLSLSFIHATMMLAAGYFRMRSGLPRPFWRYPVAYAAFHTYSVQGLLENEYLGAVFPLGEVRSITGPQALHGVYPISASDGAKWANLLVLLLMAVAYRALLLALLLCRAVRRR